MDCEHIFTLDHIDGTGVLGCQEDVDKIGGRRRFLVESLVYEETFELVICSDIMVPGPVIEFMEDGVDTR
jgi:hypothetical protein